MTKYVMFSLLFILYGCSQFTPSPSSYYYPSEKEKIVNEIREKVAKELMGKTGLSPCGSGGQMMDQVEMLALAFIYNKPIEIEESRKLLVTAVETFVSTINSNEKIRPYLGHYPFEPKNVQIRIIIRNVDGSDVQPETLSFLAATCGNCRYDVTDAKTDLLKTVYEETFAEAKAHAL